MRTFLIVSSCTLVSLVTIIGIERANAHCPLTDPLHCASHLDPTPHIPGSKEVAEQVWGESGASGYQAAARIMRERNGSGQGLDETQKRFLRQHYGGLVDQVRVAYRSSMMDEWCGFGRCTPTDSAGQTYCDRIYIRDSYKPNDADQLVLLAHEMRHSQQCRERGGEGSFGFHYFREFKRAGQNYANNSMEVDAVNTARDFTKNTICTQVGCTTSVEHWPNYEGWGIDLPVSLIATSTSTSKNVQACNGRQERISLAIALRLQGVEDGTNKVTNGWFQLSPGQCETFSYPNARVIYAMAMLPDGSTLYPKYNEENLDDNASFCIHKVNRMENLGVIACHGQTNNLDFFAPGQYKFTNFGRISGLGSFTFR